LVVAALGLLSFASAAKSTKATILVIAPNLDAAMAAYSGIQGYAIPYRLLLVPQTGVMLPRLNNTATMGNYGGIVVFNDVAYNFGGGNYRSAITDAQWEEIAAYQRAFAVRMVHLDVYPGPKYGEKHVSASWTILTDGRNHNVDRQDGVLQFWQGAAYQHHQRHGVPHRQHQDVRRDEHRWALPLSRPHRQHIVDV
jgi:hypothetical protein